MSWEQVILKCKTEPKFKASVKQSLKNAASLKDTTSVAGRVGLLQDCRAQQVVGYVVEHELAFVTNDEFKAGACCKARA